MAMWLWPANASHSFAQNGQYGTKDALTVIMDLNDDDGVIYHDRFIQVFLKIRNNSNAVVLTEIVWNVFSDDWQLQKQMRMPCRLEGNVTVNVYCPLFEFPGPGFYRLIGTVITQNGDTYEATTVIGIDPEEIVSPLDSETDMDVFWEGSLNDLAMVAPDVHMIPVERKGNTKTDLFKVEIKSIGGLTVRGWLEVPKKEGVYPALLRIPGYEGNMQPLDKYDDLIVFSFNPRDHGESDSTGVRNFAMWVRGLESKETYFYHGIYLDCIRAMDFLAGRPDVDTNRIAVWGGSQGGGLSFVLAALDQRVDLCIADIPFLCDWQRYFEITHWPEIDAWFDLHPEQTWKSVLRTLSYFDTKNMANKIKCPVIMGIGLQDDVCPPATSFAAYNAITSPKRFTIYKNAGHEQPKAHYENRFSFLRNTFDMHEARNDNGKR